MTARTAVLASVALLGGLVVICVVVSYLSIRLQRWQDWRFARPVRRGRWGWFTNLALVWRASIDAAKRKR